MGFGIFNVVEGLVDQQLLGIHHVNETVPREQWIFWDLGFLMWGAAMIVGGWGLYRGGSGRTPGRDLFMIPRRWSETLQPAA